MPKRKTPDQGSGVPPVIPARTLVQLKHSQLKPSPNNPRSLFDPEPLEALKESIKEHGVLVPLTVYKLPGQKIYGIVDGERRHRCCVALADEGVDVPMPANVVDAPDSKAGLIYMFNIHQFREQWELMPTAKALQTLIEDLETDDVAELKQVTGLSEKQIDRCKIILSYPVKYQELSMDADPVERIPSNFWVELHPVLEKADEKIPKVVEEISRDGITEKLVEKYRNRKIKSVIHFRRIMEAFDASTDEDEEKAVGGRLEEYIRDPGLETRDAFDGFVKEIQRFKKVVDATETYLKALRNAKLDYSIDNKDEIVSKLKEVNDFIFSILELLEGDTPYEDLRLADHAD